MHHRVYRRDCECGTGQAMVSSCLLRRRIAQVAYEQRRQAWLESQGYRVLRLSGRELPEEDPLQGAWDAVDMALSRRRVRSTLRGCGPGLALTA